MSKRPDSRVALEKLLKDGLAKNERKVFRDRRRRPILVHESALDGDKLAKSGRAFAEVGRRIRHFATDMKHEIGTYIAAAELPVLSQEDPEAIAGLQLPIGTVVEDGGLWLRHRPGVEEIGVNDRNEVLLREVKPADPDAGPVRGAVSAPAVAGDVAVIPRLTEEEHQADRREAEAWLRVFSQLQGRRTIRSRFKCAGIDCEHRSNGAYLARTMQMSFFDPRDIDMVRIATLLAFRFRKLRRKVPSITVISLSGLPADASSWRSLFRKVKSSSKASGSGLPEKLPESRFYDAQEKKILPAVYVHLVPSRKLPDEITVITVNAENHAQVRGHGVLSPLTSVLSLVDVISARASIAVLHDAGTAVCFTGPTGSGKTTAGTFWSARTETYRRNELARRYEAEIRRTPDAGRLGEAGIQKELERILSRVGILCQEDWVEILKEGAGQWVFWPTERVFYARTEGFPGLRHVLSGCSPLVENVAADFGASGDSDRLGRVTHENRSERVFYDPAWNHFAYDRASRKIGKIVLLERDRQLGVAVRKLAAREAVDRLLIGRSPDGRFEPLCNARQDFSALLTRLGVVGEALPPAYEAGKRGEFAPLGNGDAALGEAIFDRLDAQATLWLDMCRELPTYLVNGAYGLELTQDIHWFLCEHPDAFNEWKSVTVEEFKAAMRERYGITYGPRGEWTHIRPDQRRGL